MIYEAVHRTHEFLILFEFFTKLTIVSYTDIALKTQTSISSQSHALLIPAESFKSKTSFEHQ